MAANGSFPFTRVTGQGLLPFPPPSPKGTQEPVAQKDEGPRPVLRSSNRDRKVRGSASSFLPCACSMLGSSCGRFLGKAIPHLAVRFCGAGPSDGHASLARHSDHAAGAVSGRHSPGALPAVETDIAVESRLIHSSILSRFPVIIRDRKCLFHPFVTRKGLSCRSTNKASRTHSR